MTKSGQTYYYHYNGHGDIVQLTDFSGNIVASYTYDAWGNILQSSGTMAASNPYRYAGYRYDTETGMYYLMARYYSPNLGRFISRDAIDTNNLYEYCGNNPVNMIDPTGYASLWDDFKKIPHTVSSSVMTTVHDPVFVPALKQTGAAVGLAAVNVATAAYGDVAIAAVVGRFAKGPSKATREILLESVSNQKLRNAINEIYRPGAKTGDGGLADAIRYELKTGKLVGGKSHLLKGQERVRNLEKILKSQNLNASDRAIAQNLLNDLKNALGGVKK